MSDQHPNVDAVNQMTPAILGQDHDALVKLYEGCTFTHYLGDKGGLTRYASEPLKQQILAECDVLVGTTADCGSCTSWLMREMAAFDLKQK